MPHASWQPNHQHLLTQELHCANDKLPYADHWPHRRIAIIAYGYQSFWLQLYAEQTL